MSWDCQSKPVFKLLARDEEPPSHARIVQKTLKIMGGERLFQGCDQDRCVESGHALDLPEGALRLGRVLDERHCEHFVEDPIPEGEHIRVRLHEMGPPSLPEP